MRLPRTMLGLAGVGCLAGLLAGCVSTAKYNDLNARYQAETAGLRQAIESLERAKTSLEKDVAYYKAEVEAKEAVMGGLRDKLKLLQLQAPQMDALDRWVKEHPGTGRLDEGVEIGEALLFDAGISDLKASGKATLTDLYQKVIQGKDMMIRVDGHTDSDPIRRTKAIYKTGDNYELAAMRALHVTLLLKSLGVNPKHMFFCSFGEHKEKVPNDSKENKRRNRRVEIRFWNIGASTPGSGVGGELPRRPIPPGPGGTPPGPGSEPGPGGAGTNPDDELEK